jgi:hypothetical protein
MALTKKDKKEFIDTIKWAMENLSINDEKSMEMYSTLSITLLRACNGIVEMNDLTDVENVIKNM